MARRRSQIAGFFGRERHIEPIYLTVNSKYKCMPQNPPRTEFESGSTRDLKILLRINISLQKVFTICYLPDEKLYRYSFHMARSPFKQESLRQKVLRWFHIQDFDFEQHIYPSGGQDQVNLLAEGAKSAMELMNDPTVAEAIRLFNLRLMRKSPNLNSQAHFMDLADIMKFG